ncbi:tetratricopeptide repeat protein, partial [Desulfovibrio sp. OttesenSCG-928-F20]|nr:tetratricopeptide repeat protein [Desulfovibrio sp. OttesenSCG-928-F20]
MKPGIRALLVLLVCLLPCSALAQSETNPARRGAVDQAKAEAATLLGKGKALEAYELYSRLLREAPEDDAVNLGLARAAMGAQRPNQAIMAYERLLEKYPQESVLYKEVAQAYSAIGDKETARRYLERERSGVSADETGDLMNRFSRHYDRFQAHGKLRVGALFDSNANQGPSREIMNLGPFNNVRVPDVSEKSTFGAYLGGQVDLGYRLD